MIRPSFAYFIKINPQFGFVFGSLKAVFILFLWLYLSFLVVLFGAELLLNLWHEEVMLLKNFFLKEKLPKGDYFGEMAMLANVKRTFCAVTASSKVHLVRIKKEHFNVLLRQEQQILYNLLLEVSNKLRTTSNLI